MPQTSAMTSVALLAPTPVAPGAEATPTTSAAPPMPSASAAAEDPGPHRVVICADCNVGPIVEYLQFEHKKSTIRKESIVILEEVRRVLIEHPEIQVEIRGHIDASEREYLQNTYGHHRANAVRKWLIEKGIGANRLVAKDYGDSVPLVNPKSAADRALNRRVDFKRIPQQP